MRMRAGGAGVGAAARERCAWRRLLERPQPPEGLEARLLADLAAQPPRGVERLARLGAAAAAAGVLLALWALPRWHAAPVPVQAALEHIDREAGLVGALDGGYRHWLRRHGVSAPPEGFVVTFSKDCVVGPTPVKHLRLRTPSGAVVSLFIHAGPARRWLASVSQSGRLDGRRWRTVATSGSVSALLVHDVRVSAQLVHALVHAMFERAPARSV